MPNFFPRWTNWLPIKILIGLGCMGTIAVAVLFWVFTPEYSRAGYQPQQPIPFEHTIHAGQLGMDCRYCHTFVEDSAHSNVPNAQVCWNCHSTGKVLSDSPKLEPLRQAMDVNYEGYTGEPIQWVQIHQTPDYAYFNHSVHVNRGVSCVECHGKVNEMEVVFHAKGQSMSFCLECHREPEKALRPLDQVTNLDWKPEDLDRQAFYAYLTGLSKGHGAEAPDYSEEMAEDGPLTQKEIGTKLKEAWSVRPPEDCTTCHR